MLACYARCVRAACLAAALLVACSEAPLFPDARAPIADSGGARDAGAIDRGFEDTGSRDADPADVTIADLGFDDRGAPIDAGAPFTPGDPPDGDPSFAITDGAEIMRQGMELPWWAGPQGGHHVYAAARASRALLDPLSDQERRNLIVIYELRRDRDQVLLAETRRTGGFTLTATGWDAPTVLVILKEGFDVQQVSGELLRLSATVRLAGGRQLSSRVYVFTRCCN